MNNFPTDLTVPASQSMEPLPRLTPQVIAKLAREIAMDVNHLEITLGHFNLSIGQYERIKAIPAFVRLLEMARQEWNSAKNAPERIKIEAAATLEDIMPKLSARLVNDKESLDHVVKGATLLAKVAGVSEPVGLGNGEKFIINIDLGEGKKIELAKDITPVIEQPKLVTDEPPKAT